MILVTGGTGFLGQQVCRRLAVQGRPHHVTGLRRGVDLRDRAATFALFEALRPEYVVNCASLVGGIQFGYRYPVELFTDNLRMTINVLEAVKEFGVKRLVQPISNCVYPGAAEVFRESEIWDGPIHESVLVYGFARKAAWVGSWAFNRQHGVDTINVVLPNLYGPEDHFDEERSHALGALIMKIVRAKREKLPRVVIWGSGKPVREWMHVYDGADAMILGLNAAPFEDVINVGVQKGISIFELATMIKQFAAYEGELVLDASKPDGAPFKTIDGRRGRSHLGFTPKVPFRIGVEETVRWYIESSAKA
jgi:GDP-L-fucose synthase